VAIRSANLVSLGVKAEPSPTKRRKYLLLSRKPGGFAQVRLEFVELSGGLAGMIFVRRSRPPGWTMKTQSDPGDGDLARGLRAGDEDCFLQLYRRYQGVLFRFALHMTGSRSAAEDITQEVFMELIRNPGRYDPARGAFRPFLLSVGRNHVLRMFERRRPWSDLDEEDVKDSRAVEDGPGPAGDAERNDRIERVRKAVLTLPGSYREAVVLCDLDEMSYAEAAEALGCAVGTVRSRLHRGRALLAEKLKSLRECSCRSTARER
jgi:RNA polymerase sigma-70 factor (ECF subfamily)